jgi:hypothetical protein
MLIRRLFLVESCPDQISHKLKGICMVDKNAGGKSSKMRRIIGHYTRG